MSDNKYNGWSNYATWRINLELFNDIDFVEEDFCDDKIDVDHLKDMVEEWVFSYPQEGGLVEDYARAFIAQVNFHEIAEHINDELSYEREREAEADQYE